LHFEKGKNYGKSKVLERFRAWCDFYKCNLVYCGSCNSMPEVITEECLLCKGKGVITHPLAAYKDEDTGEVVTYRDQAAVDDPWLADIKAYCLQKKNTGVPSAYVLTLIAEIWQLTYSCLALARELKRKREGKVNN
jgi:hypothetical protein